MMIQVKPTEKELEEGVKSLYRAVQYVLDNKGEGEDWTNETVCKALNKLSKDMGLELRFFSDGEDVRIGSDDLEADYFSFPDLIVRFNEEFPGCLE